MIWFHNESYEYGSHEVVTNHGAELSHDLLSGAAAFAAADEYEEHVSRNGKPADHTLAKELLAGFTGAYIDKKFETRGLDYLDREKAKYEAKKRVENALLVADAAANC
ncbi:hypothetical protein BDM02DRAFT_3189799 [Thelephora ganbajun]|uniref:Uncharacterized protein n=1 Tax=Thelephora ganbajun TaxID=370292 RepID=A0ACB6Z745_THEGA|nr:hypothetical protein BDM02DRAFT_3189799 [Thelephora ganbajun]